MLLTVVQDGIELTEKGFHNNIRASHDFHRIWAWADLGLGQILGTVHPCHLLFFLPFAGSSP